MGRSGIKDGKAWREILKELKNPLAHGACSLSAAEFLHSRGFSKAAETVYLELLARDPNCMDSINGLAWIAQLSGRTEEANHWQRQAALVEVRRLKLKPEDEADAVAFRLAAAGHEQAPAKVPSGYVTALFDNYAENFDTHLIDVLKYRGPEEVAALVQRLRTTDCPLWDVLDAGCGTGLLGPLLRPWAARLDGVDLSPEMLEKAKQRAVYDNLDVGELCAELTARPMQYDLIALADVLVYFGDLQPMFTALATAIRPGGYLVFTVERSFDPEYQLLSCSHYSHHEDYVLNASRKAGWSLVTHYNVTCRHEQNRPVDALLFAFQFSTAQ